MENIGYTIAILTLILSLDLIGTIRNYFMIKENKRIAKENTEKINKNKKRSKKNKEEINRI